MGLAHPMLHKMTVHSSEANVPADHTPLVRTPRLGEEHARPRACRCWGSVTSEVFDYSVRLFSISSTTVNIGIDQLRSLSTPSRNTYSPLIMPMKVPDWDDLPDVEGMPKGKSSNALSSSIADR